MNALVAPRLGLELAHQACVAPQPFTRARVAGVHSYTVLALQLGGHAAIEHRGEHQTVAGDLHVIPSGDPHRVLESRGLEMWWLAIADERLEAPSFGPLRDVVTQVKRGARPTVSLSSARVERVRGLFDEMAEEATGNDAYSALRLESLASLVGVEIGRARGGASAAALPTEGASLATRALAFIQAHGLEPISLADVARAVGRSPAHVTTAVRRATGRTVGAWIVDARLTEARRRLLASDEYVDVIAERVGYRDVRHFTRTFRAHQGMTPAAFRRAHSRVKTPSP